MRLPLVSRPRAIPRQGLVIWASQRLRSLVATDEDGQDTVLGLLSRLGRAASKGDLLIHSGARWMRLPLGDDDQVLTADSAEASGVKWADSAGGGGGTSYRDTTTDRRVIRWVANVQEASMKGIGATNLQADAGTLVQVWGNDGGFLARTPNGTGIGAKGRWHLNNNDNQRTVKLQTSPQVSIRVKTGSSLTRALFWVGISESIPTNSATTPRKRLMFRYLEGVDTKWMASVYDGTTHTQLAMATTVTADTVYKLEIDYDQSAGEATFTVNGTDTLTISSDLPSETVLMGADVTVYNHTSGGAPWPQLALASFLIAAY